MCKLPCKRGKSRPYAFEGSVPNSAICFALMPYLFDLFLLRLLQLTQTRKLIVPWFNKYTDFLNDELQPLNVLEAMWEVSRLVKMHMVKYYDKELISILIVESLKFCVPVCQDSGQASHEWVFKTKSQNTAKIMNLMNLQMVNSVVFKKMADKKTARGKEGPIANDLKSEFASMGIVTTSEKKASKAVKDKQDLEDAKSRFVELSAEAAGSSSGSAGKAANSDAQLPKSKSKRVLEDDGDDCSDDDDDDDNDGDDEDISSYSSSHEKKKRKQDRNTKAVKKDKGNTPEKQKQGGKRTASKAKTVKSTKPENARKIMKKIAAQTIILQAWSDAEKGVFNQMVKSISGDEHRVRTALDDFLQSQIFAQDYLKCQRQERQVKLMMASENLGLRPDRAAKTIAALSKHSSSSPAAQTPAEAKRELKAEKDAYYSSLSFCTSHFLGLMWAGKASTSGKAYSIWSPLRNELQNIQIRACDTMFNAETLECVPAMHDDDEGQAEKSGDNVDALTLAKMLCKTFSSEPTSEVIGDEDEDAVTKRVLYVMAVSNDQVVTPMRNYVHDMLRQPLQLHDAPRNCLKLLSKDAESGTLNMELVDLLGFIQSQIDGILPMEGLNFAADVNDVFLSTGSFPHRTAKAGFICKHLFGVLLEHWSELSFIPSEI